MENNIIHIAIEKMMLTANGKINLKIKTSIGQGEFLSVFGSSGAGKTTLLRIIAGLEKPDRGLVKFGNEVWFDSKKKICISPQKRNLSLMFQDYALFPNMTVEQNIRYAQPVDDNKAVENLLSIFGLTELRKRKPAFLSGGQRQRVALARSLARKPKLLLLDEPLSALDIEMRKALQGEIHKAHRLSGVTTIMVSHDLNEVFRLATKVLCIENGKILRSGSPDEVFIDNSISGKVQITGQIARISKQDVINIITVITGVNQVIKVIAFDNDMLNLKIGDSVMVSTKAFNPIINKLSANFTEANDIPQRNS